MPRKNPSLRSLKSVATLLLSMLAACQGNARAVEAGAHAGAPLRTGLQFDDIQSGVVHERRSTGRAAVSLRWDVPLTKADFEEWRHLVAKGRPASPLGMFRTGENGVLHTALGDYEFVVGEAKSAGFLFRLHCVPIGRPEGRREVHLQWEADDGHALMAALRGKLLARAGEATRAGYMARPR